MKKILGVVLGLVVLAGSAWAGGDGKCGCPMQKAAEGSSRVAAAPSSQVTADKEVSGNGGNFGAIKAEAPAA